MDIDTKEKYRYLSIPESIDTFPITSCDGSRGIFQKGCKMTPDRLHSDTVGRVANKVRVEGGEYFYGP